MPGTDDLVTGFDARVAVDGDDAWSEDKKRQWQLFRLDVRRPLSIDTLVWPSLFDRHDELRPDYIGLGYPLWEKLSRLNQIVKRHDQLKALDSDVIACALIVELCTLAERRVWHEFLPPVGKENIGPSTILASPSAIDERWTFLGYDVADESGTSALITMRHPTDAGQIDELRTRWGPRLNDAHLFDDRSQAGQFKKLSNQRIPEHAPFFVYGLWLVTDDR